MKHFLYQLWLLVDQGVNVFTGGYADETFSAKCYREDWTRSMWVLNRIYFWQKNHCRSAFQNELSRKHLPEVYQ